MMYYPTYQTHPNNYNANPYIINNQCHDNIDIVIGTPVINPEVKPQYKRFIVKVLLLIFLQSIITLSICIPSYLNREIIIDMINKNNNIFIYPIIFFIISSITIICCRNINKYILYTLFGVFTLSLSLVIAISILPYKPLIILQAIVGTVLSIFCAIIFVLLSQIYDFDIQPIGTAIISISVSILALTLFEIFTFQSYPAFEFAISMLFISLFTIYLMFELHTLYNSTDILMFESPIYPAISIYLDIVNIFMYMLNCINICNE